VRFDVERDHGAVVRVRDEGERAGTQAGKGDLPRRCGAGGVGWLERQPGDGGDDSQRGVLGRAHRFDAFAVACAEGQEQTETEKSRHTRSSRETPKV